MLENTIDFEGSVRLLGEWIEKSQNSFLSIRKKNQRIDMKSENQVGYLREGALSVYRIDNDIVTLNIEAPAIIGLHQLFHTQRSHYLRCDRYCELIVINEADLIAILDREMLWGHAFIILSRHLEMYFQRERRLVHKNIKGIVIEHLKHLWDQSEDIRSRTSVYSFILSRNQISRSSVHKTIKSLIDDGVIKIQRGKLLWMNNID
ncbi:TPA: transcriptional regulator [Enterobacter cloacae]|nr:transcriptional regulator [Enterobacter cloacae]